MTLRVYPTDVPGQFLFSAAEGVLGATREYTIDDSAYVAIGPFSAGVYDYELRDAGAFVSKQSDAYVLEQEWEEDTGYSEGDLVKNLDDVTDPEIPVWRVYRCTTAGTTDTIDAWNDDTLYAEGDRVENGVNAYVCTVGGTSQMGGGGPTGTNESGIVDGTAEWGFIGLAADLPTGPTGIGDGIEDGTAEWEYVADSVAPMLVDDTETWEYPEDAGDGFEVVNPEHDGYVAVKAFSGGTVRFRVRCRTSLIVELPEAP